MSKLESTSIKIFLGIEAHNLASKLAAEAIAFASEFNKRNQGKQIYLNTLAIYAVENYLKWQNYQVNIDSSDFGNVILRSRLSLADLFIEGIGKLECRFIWSEQDNLVIPAEATEDRIGYVIVRLNDELDEASLLGFYPSLDNLESSISIDDLKSVDEFLDYLNRLELANNLFNDRNDPLVAKVIEQLEDIDISDLVIQLERIYRLEVDTEQPYAVKDMLAGNLVGIGIDREASETEDDLELMELAEEVVERLNQVWLDIDN